MESIGNARSFLSAAREVALNKPIIVIKPGRSAAAAKAAASHTGSLTGSDEVLEAAFRRSGVLRVNNIADLFYMAEVLSKQPSPKGPRLTIVTNAGGPGVLATDALIMGGGELAELTPETMEAYNAVLPATWSHNNPVDIIGDASPERYAKALEIAAKDPNSDGMLVILTPQAMTDPTQHRRAAEAAGQAGRQAGAGKLDGRRGRGRRRGDSQPRQHSHLPLSRHRRARLQLHVAVQLQPEGAVRNAGHAGGFRRLDARPQAGGRHHSAGRAAKGAPS